MIRIVFFQEAGGTSPVLDFLLNASAQVQEQAQARIQLLSERGHNLRRPHADYLEDGIYELRWHTGRVQYRILYFFHGQGTAVLLHGFTKEGSIPRPDRNRAHNRKELFISNPKIHTKLFS